MVALLYEFIGTALVVTAFNLSSHSAAVRAMVYAGAFLFAYQISGGHFNPATSLAVFIVEHKYKEQLAYLITVMIV